MDAVLALDPLVAWASAAPTLDVVAGRVEHHDRRARHRGLIRLERARAMQEKHLVLGIDREARHVTDAELRRHFRPSRLHLETRQRALRLRPTVDRIEQRAGNAGRQNRMNEAWAHEFLPFDCCVLLE